MSIPAHVLISAMAQDLLDKDFIGKSDPYFTVTIDGEELAHSETIMNNLFPRWDDLQIPLDRDSESYTLDSEVEINVWDDDSGLRGKDDFLGTCRLCLGDFLEADNLELELYKPESSSHKDRGSFTICSVQGLSESDYDAIVSSLQYTFPHDGENNDAVEQYLDTLASETDGSENAFNAKEISEMAGSYITGNAQSAILPDEIGYPVYRIDADHHRSIPFDSEFVGHVDAIRIRLGSEHTGDVDTPIGLITHDDHFMFSVQDVLDTYGDRLDYQPHRVDLISPLRYKGVRFAPVALYLLYKHRNSEDPSSFILEAGTGLGTTAVIYLGETMDTTIREPSGYKPTPWASEENTYHGTCTTDGHDPVHASIDSYQPGSDEPYIRVNLQYTRIDTAADEPTDDQFIDPKSLVLGAFERIQVITDGFGQLKESDKVAVHFAEEGRKLDWEQQPPVNVVPVPED